MKTPSLFPSLFRTTTGKIIVIAVAVATIAVALNVATSASGPVSQQVKLISVPLKETHESPGYTITAEIPQLTGSDDPRVRAFNERLDGIVKNEVNMKRLYVVDAEADGSSLDITYELVSQIANIWSLRLNISFYFAGAAHPGLEITTVNYDLAQGKELELNALFLPGTNYLESISKYCTAELSNQGIDFDAFSTGAAPTLENYSNWNITADGIQITFEPGIVDAYAAGPKTIQVPYSVIQTIIDPQGPLRPILR